MLHSVSHQRALRSVLVIAAVSAVIAQLLSGTARAATIPFNEAILYSINPEGSQASDDGSIHLDSTNTISASPVAEAYSRAGAWGTVDITASANLATGQLKMRGSASAVDGSGWSYVQSNAIFGDGFRVTAPGGAPFDWHSSGASFTLNLDGSMVSSRPLDGQYYPAMFVVLSILAPGTLDPNAPLVNGPTALDYYYWNIGNPSAQIYYNDQQGNHLLLDPTESFDDIPSTLTAEFNPGGDFDWVLLVGASGQVSAPGESFDFDLGHTVTVTYNAPQDSVTHTVSGQFGGFDQVATVAEPATLALLLGALATLGGLRHARLRRGV